jgi:hypothetical protein
MLWVERIADRLPNWKARLLSLTGWTTMVKVDWIADRLPNWKAFDHSGLYPYCYKCLQMGDQIYRQNPEGVSMERKEEC